MNFQFVVLALALITCGLTAQAAGPIDIAKAKQSLWPAEIQSHQAFDEASRAEILVFLNLYQDITASDPTPETLGIKKVNLDSIKTWKIRSEKYWLNAYLVSAKTCSVGSKLGCGFKGASFTELLKFATQFQDKLPAQYQAWVKMSETFYRIYVREQLRLAALFPNPTSEALPLAAGEILGDQFKDREFLLSLDDGPTPIGGYSDSYGDLLRKEGLSIYFFSLGNALEARIKKSSIEQVRKLYDKQCLASHGYEHKSHQKWIEWKSSLEKTRTLINHINPGVPVAFRPPFGQRSPELIAEQTKGMTSAPIILWNIDSQDWHSKIAADEVGDRVQKLMLLWRKGIIVSHDVHAKSLTALPQLIKFSKEAGLHWVDCHQLKL